ncbi:MAG: hypothetical protein F4059_07445 [Gemmatimonadetes bacterium]|nr:hypothetical protein [Gemmatimonadota bacterium]
MKALQISGSIDDIARRHFGQEAKRFRDLAGLLAPVAIVSLFGLLFRMTPALLLFLPAAVGCLVSERLHRKHVRGRLEAFRAGDPDAVQAVCDFAATEFRRTIKSHRARTLGNNTEWGRARGSLEKALDDAQRSVSYWRKRTGRDRDNELAQSQLEVASELEAKLQLALDKLNLQAGVLRNFYNECEARLAVMDGYRQDMVESRRLEELSGRTDVVIAHAEGTLAAIGKQFVREADAVGRALGGLAEVQIRSLAGEAPVDNVEYLADRIIENSDSEQRAIKALDKELQRSDGENVMHT